MPVRRGPFAGMGKPEPLKYHLPTLLSPGSRGPA
ncbi:type II toxin-antitoxin system YoeB family toxin [Streptomyces diastaticus]|nr:type II toxin-antitoxin system YoeB family toxin [Streptomyces diastaticus]